MGADFTFETRFSYSATATSLCIQTRGDPSFSQADLLSALSAFCASSALQPNQCQTLTSVSIDSSFFPGVFEQGKSEFPSSWEYEDLAADYGGRPLSTVIDRNTAEIELFRGDDEASQNVKIKTVSAPVNVDASCAKCKIFSSAEEELIDSYYEIGGMSGGDLKIVANLPSDFQARRGRVAVGRPVHYLSQLIVHLLVTRFNATASSIQIDISPSASCSAHELVYTHRSKPLSQLMNFTLLTSDNLYAELFSRQVGMLKSTPEQIANPFADITALGVASVRKILINDLQVDETSFVQHDGSGVSPKNLVSPQALSEIFQNMYLLQKTRPIAPLFKSMLPVGGISGTLINRFKNNPGIVQAKTGSISNVNTLSGYITNEKFASGSLVFSIMVNLSSESASMVRNTIDSIALAFAQTNPTC